MRLVIFCVACWLLMGFSCSKHESGGGSSAPVTAQASFSGVASYNSYYYAPRDTSIKMDSQTVYIAVDTGALNPNLYIYSTKTDASGNFEFSGLDPTLQYYIFSRPNIASSSTFTAPYLGVDTTQLPYNGAVSYILLADLNSKKTNGISVLTQDVYGGAISRALVIIYSTLGAAQKDTVFSGGGSFVTLVTDSLGKGLATTVPVGNLYINALLKLDSVDFLRAIAVPVVVSAKGFQLQTIVLH